MDEHSSRRIIRTPDSVVDWRLRVGEPREASGSKLKELVGEPARDKYG